MSAFPFSIGLFPDNSEVSIISNIDGYWYSLYIVENSKVRFMSLDPAEYPPAAFVFRKTSEGFTLTSNFGSLTTSLDGITPVGSYPEFINLKPLINSSTPNTLYSGLSYVSSTDPFMTPFALLPLNEETNKPLKAKPFGGSTDKDVFIANFNIIFIPVVVPQDAPFDTAWENDNGVCQSPRNIYPFLSIWMQGLNGCKPGNPNKCVYTTLQECETNLVVPYCSSSNTCGDCIGVCSNDINKLCVYDYNRHTSPYYSCDPVSPNPSDEETSNTTKIFLGLMIGLSIIILLSGIVTKKNNVIFIGGILSIICILSYIYFVNNN